MTKKEILSWLRETDQQKLEELWKKADRVREESVGNAVHLRGLIEISSYCVRRCAYCGLNALNSIERYRMSLDEILSCVDEAVEYGYGTVVLQSGEDFGISQEWVTQLIKKIKDQSPLAVTLSLGERTKKELSAWKKAGADRYLLRFETSNPELFALIHPPRPDQKYDRFEVLRYLRELGYEVGSGVMIGIPGQSYDTLARDLLLFKELDLDMIGVGPYIAHPESLLGKNPGLKSMEAEEQVPATELMTYKTVALTRILCPEANIPSTTALATLNTESGRELGLSRGANVVMPNLTPAQYRRFYEIYPAKACIDETARQCHFCMQGRILSLGRELGKGQGGRMRK